MGKLVKNLFGKFVLRVYISVSIILFNIINTFQISSRNINSVINNSFLKSSIQKIFECEMIEIPKTDITL